MPHVHAQFSPQKKETSKSILGEPLWIVPLVQTFSFFILFSPHAQMFTDVIQAIHTVNFASRKF